MALALSLLGGYWRPALLAIGLIGAIWLGYWVNGRLERAKEADTLEKNLATLEQQLVVLRGERVLLSAQLADMDKALAVEVKEIVKYVPKYIVGKCSLKPDGVRGINKARGVPGTSGGVVAPSIPADPAP